MKKALAKFSVGMLLLLAFMILVASACADSKTSGDYSAAQRQEQTQTTKDSNNLSEAEKVGVTCRKMVEMAKSSTDSLIAFSSHPFNNYSSCGYWILADGGN